MVVLTRADVFSDVGVFLTGHSWHGVIGFAHSQKERRVVASCNLDDVGNERCGAEAKDVYTLK